VKESLGLGSVGTTYDLSSFKMKIKSVDISQDGTTWTNIFKDGAEEFDVVAGSGTLTFNDVEEGTYNFVMVEFSADAAFRRGDCSDDKTLAMTDSETM